MPVLLKDNETLQLLIIRFHSVQLKSLQKSLHWTLGKLSIFPLLKKTFFIQFTLACLTKEIKVDMHKPELHQYVVSDLRGLEIRRGASCAQRGDLWECIACCKLIKEVMKFRQILGMLELLKLHLHSRYGSSMCRARIALFKNNSWFFLSVEWQRHRMKQGGRKYTLRSWIHI